MILQQFFLERVVLAILVGALLGMEREYSKHQEIVGIRTFSLISLLGTLCVLLGDYFPSNLLILLGFIAVCGFSIFLYAKKLRGGKGFTTNIALIITYILGILIGFGLYAEAVFLSVAVAVLLFSKERLHHLVEDMTEKEVGDLLEFLILLGIIYPLIPHTISFYGITIPLFTIWALIVLISLMNFAVFIGARYMSAKHEIETMSFLGGMISSSATTASLLSLYKKKKKIPIVMIGGFLLINAAMLLRNFFFVSITTPEVIKLLILPVGIGMSFLIIVAYFKFKEKKKVHKIHIKSPFNVVHGLKLGIAVFVLYILLDIAQMSFGGGALFITAFIGGLVSSSATTLSLISLFSTNIISLPILGIGMTINLIGGLVSNQLVSIFYRRFDLLKKTFVPIMISIFLLVISIYVSIYFLL